MLKPYLVVIDSGSKGVCDVNSKINCITKVELISLKELRCKLGDHIILLKVALSRILLFVSS